ncbi:unnamed protein product [Lactuca virosa]|uniref:Secreted protein n=1 Tax=Lactuca virosa TaxID=75947 RepID=A0AAU9PBV0_9ASTR|nr:unnamed protein product [Lactuca virosa]
MKLSLICFSKVIVLLQGFINKIVSFIHTPPESIHDNYLTLQPPSSLLPGKRRGEHEGVSERDREGGCSNDVRGDGGGAAPYLVTQRTYADPSIRITTTRFTSSRAI